MERNASRKLKIGVQSRFYPISTVGFRTFFPEILASPNVHVLNTSPLRKVVSDEGRIFRSPRLLGVRFWKKFFASTLQKRRFHINLKWSLYLGVWVERNLCRTIILEFGPRWACNIYFYLWAILSIPFGNFKSTSCFSPGLHQ